MWIALILGVVEGLTEFLPISSTGHLILASAWLGFSGKRAEVFEIFIQLGAILSVVWEFRERLRHQARGLFRRPEPRRFALAIAVAFLPAAVIGLMLHDRITEQLFSPRTVAAALIAGAVLILVVEALPLRARTHNVEAVSLSQAALIGFAQCLALWPGFSRSAATILGGMVAGFDRRSSTEFSFFLAIPTIGAASIYSLAKNLNVLETSDVLPLAVSFITAFFVALVSIRWLLRYVSSHSFRIFAWYRLALGGLLLLALR